MVVVVTNKEKVSVSAVNGEKGTFNSNIQKAQWA